MLDEQKELFEYNVNKLLNVPLYYKYEANKKLLEDVKNKKIVIYTAFTGNYDNLKDPEYIDENCDYVCFTDNPHIKSSIWKIIPMGHYNLDNNRKAKQYKLFPHKYLSQYEYSFWLDGSFQIIGSIREYIYKYMSRSANDWKAMPELLIRLAMSTISDTVIVPAADYLGHGPEGRINFPGTSGENWMWRMKEGAFTDSIKGVIAEIVGVYGRYQKALPKPEPVTDTVPEEDKEGAETDDSD